MFYITEIELDGIYIIDYISLMKPEVYRNRDLDDKYKMIAEEAKQILINRKIKIEWKK